MTAEQDASGAPESPSPAARRDAWSRYWARGALHSCIGTYGERYEGTIGAFWQAVFASLPQIARVLDVATGNGVLARMLLDHCRSPGVMCDAVDIATVQLPWLATLHPADRGRVRLQGGVDAAALPFPDRAFQLVMSQYGIEYTELDRTVPEMLRVLAPGGQVAMVLHQAQGRPATLAKIEIDHLGWLLREDSFLDAVAALLEPMARAATAQGRASLQRDAAANAARERFNVLQGQLSQRAASGDGADVLFEARDAAGSLFALAGRQGASAATQALSALREELAAGATRLRDLCSHALDGGQARALAERFAAALSAPITLNELHERGGHLMGWSLRSG